LLRLLVNVITAAGSADADHARTHDGFWPTPFTRESWPYERTMCIGAYIKHSSSHQEGLCNI